MENTSLQCDRSCMSSRFLLAPTWLLFIFLTHSLDSGLGVILTKKNQAARYFFFKLQRKTAFQSLWKTRGILICPYWLFLRLIIYYYIVSMHRKKKKKKKPSLFLTSSGQEMRSGRTGYSRCVHSISPSLNMAALSQSAHPNEPRRRRLI